MLFFGCFYTCMKTPLHEYFAIILLNVILAPLLYFVFVSKTARQSRDLEILQEWLRNDNTNIQDHTSVRTAAADSGQKKTTHPK
jgi:hypothetical protein